MNSVPVRLAAFAVVLLVCFTAAFALGSVVGPFDTDSTETYFSEPGTEHDRSHGG